MNLWRWQYPVLCFDGCWLAQSILRQALLSFALLRLAPFSLDFDQGKLGWELSLPTEQLEPRLFEDLLVGSNSGCIA